MTPKGKAKKDVIEEIVPVILEAQQENGGDVVEFMKEHKKEREGKQREEI